MFCLVSKQKKKMFVITFYQPSLLHKDLKITIVKKNNNSTLGPRNHFNNIVTQSKTELYYPVLGIFLNNFLFKRNQLCFRSLSFKTL